MTDVSTGKSQPVLLRINLNDAGVLKLYCPIVIVPGNKKYPTRLSGWVVQIISRAPSHHVARHVPRPPPTDYGGPSVIKGRIMFYSNLFNSNGLKREIVGLIP